MKSYKECAFFDKDENCLDEEYTWGYKYPCNKRNDCPTFKRKSK